MDSLNRRNVLKGMGAAAMLPASSDPAGMGMRRLDVRAGNPNVVVALPAVVASVPNPVAVLWWKWRTGFDDASGRSDADDNLCACHERCGKYETANGGEYSLLHQSCSFRGLTSCCVVGHKNAPRCCEQLSKIYRFASLRIPKGCLCWW